MPAGSYTSPSISVYLPFFFFLLLHRPCSDLCSSSEVHVVSALIIQSPIDK